MKRYVLVSILVLLVALFAFHFIAANQAEKQIDTTIQMQADSAGTALSVQYSSIEVSPFSGDVAFRDITIVRGTDIQRSAKLMVDLRYLDFLNIYLGGVEYGLNKLYAADMHLEKVSYLDRATMQEYAAVNATVNYSGNILDGIRTFFAGQPQTHRHEINITGTQLRYSRPKPVIGTFKSDSASLRLDYPKTNEEKQGVTNSVEFKNITWTPPARIQKKYGFFIQGFGYKLDALPISSFGFSFSGMGMDMRTATGTDTRNETGMGTKSGRSEIIISEGRTQTDLFNIEFEGTIIRDSTWSDARLAPLTLSMVDLSEQFENVLSNAEQLLGITIPKKENRIRLQLRGPLANPRISGSN